MEGWISIHRKITEHPDYFSEPFTRMGAWIDLLILANHKENTMRKRGIKITIKRGETAMSHDTLAMRWKWSRGKVKRYLDDLENDEQIVQQKSNVIGCISICNYNNYQQNNTADEPANSTGDSTANRRQIVQQTDINNNYNKNNKINNRHTHLFFNLNFSLRVRAENFLAWVAAEYPAVQQMAEPLTEQHAQWIVSKYAAQDVERIVMAIDNKGATKNKSAYATFCAYADSDKIIKERRQTKDKLYTYADVCNLIDKKTGSFDDFTKQEVGGIIYYKKKDFLTTDR